MPKQKKSPKPASITGEEAAALAKQMAPKGIKQDRPRPKGSSQ